MIARSILGFRTAILPKTSAFNANFKKTTKHSIPMSSFTTLKNQFEEFNEVLPYEPHAHGSAMITIPSLTVPDDTNIDPFRETNFRDRLEATVLACRNLKKSALWLQVPMNRSRLIEYMSDSGFQYHHAEGQVANLYLWLNDEIECKIPSYGTHQVGVGALVVNSKDEILCVRELRKNYLPWKMPGET